ncbi:MAG: ABC transporter permease [Gemmatimonadetes bacterium]|nr:ABC transporter permease [Gemmatimonadota bacterium]
MSAPPRWARWLVAVTAPPRDRDVMLGDLDEEHEARVAAGDARGARRWYGRQALRSVGPNRLRRLREGRRGTHDYGRGGGMETLTQDVRWAGRTLVRSPGFAATVILTLALGIGANAIVFSVVNGLVLNPFPFPEPERLVGVGAAFPRAGRELTFWESLSTAEVQDVGQGATTLERVVAWDMGNRQIAGEGPPRNVFTGFWWGDALRTLGMEPHLGRGFSDEEVREGRAVALVSHRLWRESFGADPSLVGRSILVGGSPHAVVGVLPPGALLYGMDLWTVMPAGMDAFARDRRQFQMLARLRDGATLEQANAELEALAAGVAADHAAAFPEYVGWRLQARTWNDINVGILRPAAAVLLAAVTLVLLLVCANVANMLLARSSARRREMAVRSALGAGRSRLVRQLLSESLLVALVGAAAGLVLARLALGGVQRVLDSMALPVAGNVAPDVTVLLYTAGVAVAAAAVFGLLPALHAAGGDVREAMAEGAATGSASRQRLQRGLVGAEVALALGLLAGGGLLVNSMARMGRVDPGFDAEGVLTARLTLQWEEYGQDGIRAFFQRLREEVGALPGVTDVATTSQFPPRSFLRNRFWIEGMTLESGGALPLALTTVVSPGYFKAMGMQIVRGRTLETTDVSGGEMVGVLNEAAARRWFPDRDPLGARLKLGGPDSDEPWFRVVGVVADTRNRGLDQPTEPELFASQQQAGGGNQYFLVVRIDVPPRSVLPGIRRAVASLDPDQPIYAVQTVEEAFEEGAATRRATTLSLGLFALFALALAGVGIYGVVAYAVAARTREIGLRIALGAEGGRVRRLVVRQALVPVAAGGAVGLALAMVLGRAMEGMLFQVRGTDPWTLAAVTAVLAVVALAASWIPARRASRLDPVRALRME